MPRQSAGSTRGSDDWIERVRSASDIVEVISQSVSLKRVGRNWVGLCPFHQEKTPSFSVHPERQFYHCFSCKAGGDVFRFVQESEKIGFVEAAELLSRRAGIPVPERRAGPSGQRTGLLEALEAAAAAFEQWLADPDRGARVRSYLEGRDLTADMIREFRIGVAPPGWDNLLQRLRPRFREDILVQAGLAVPRAGGRGHYDRFRNRLVIPLVAPGGQVVGFGARALDPDDQPKYLNSPESPVYHKGAFLFGFDQARRHATHDGELIVVEGYFDVIRLHQSGIRNTVATSGTALTTDQARVLKRVASRVALTYDGDAAGQEAMSRSLGVLMGEGLEVAIVDLPDGHDPDSLVRAGGAGAWQEARDRANDPIEFIQRHGLRAGASESPALRAVVQLAAAVQDPIRRQRLLEKGSRVFGLSEAVLARAVTLELSGQSTEKPLAAAVRQRSQGASHLERELLQALFQAPEMLEDTRARLAPEDFHDPEARGLAHWMWSGSEEEPEDPAVAALLRELTASALEGWDWARVAEANTRRLVQKKLETRSREVRQRIEQLQRQGRSDDPETLRLLVETQEIHRNIGELNR